LLAESLAGTGEENERFAEYKVAEMSIQLSRAPPRRILDFGCGVGRSLGLLARYFPEAAICGYDPSPHSIDEARRRVPAATLYGASAVLPEAGFDAVLAANVFHHIAQEQRHAAIRSCGNALARAAACSCSSIIPTIRSPGACSSAVPSTKARPCCGVAR
jgi:SAM-dependent methyltransferase